MPLGEFEKRVYIKAVNEETLMELVMTPWQKEIFDQYTERYGDISKCNVTSHREEESSLIILEFVEAPDTAFTLGLCDFKGDLDTFCELSLHSTHLDFEQRSEYLLSIANQVVYRGISFWEKDYLGFEGIHQYPAQEDYKGFTSLILARNPDRYTVTYTSPPFRKEDSGLKEQCRIYEMIMLYDAEYGHLIGRKDVREVLDAAPAVLRNVLTREPFLM